MNDEQSLLNALWRVCGCVIPGKDEGHITLRDQFKKTWICLGCNRSFRVHCEIVNHMDSENHLVMVNSDFGQIK